MWLGWNAIDRASAARRRRWRRWIALIVALALGALLAIAVVDRIRKQDAKRDAYVAAWICSHRALRCGHVTPAAIERAWNRRERIYGIAAVSLVLLGGAAFGATWAGRGAGLAEPS